MPIFTHTQNKATVLAAFDTLFNRKDVVAANTEDKHHQEHQKVVPPVTWGKEMIGSAEDCPDNETVHKIFFCNIFPLSVAFINELVEDDANGYGKLNSP